MSEEKKVRERATNWRLIARVFLFIAGFNVVIRSDMWVSLCILMVVCIQLLPLLWVKKIRAYFSEKNCRVIAEKVKGVIRRWHAASVNTKASENTPSSCVNIMVEPVTGHHQEDQHSSCADKAALPNDICDDARFEDVWRDCDTK
jgi:uncharacterized MAPEG superfamily protein